MMTIFPGCKCCGPCWKCYAQYLKPPVPDVACGVSANGYNYTLPKSIHLKTFLTVGNVLSSQGGAAYDVADIQAWVDSLDFKVFLYEDPSNGQLTYRARGGVDAMCKDMPPAFGESAFYQSPFLVDLIGEDYPACNNPVYDSAVLRSCVNIDAACDNLQVRNQRGPYGTANSGLSFYSCRTIPGIDSTSFNRDNFENFILADTPNKQFFNVVYDNRHSLIINYCTSFSQQLQQDIRELTGYLQIEFQYETEESIGRCCFKEETEDGCNTCEDLTKEECEEKDGLWSAGITCEDTPCEIVDFKCFKKPPETEESDLEWVLQDDKCHKTQEACEQDCSDCPPPFCNCDGLNVLANALTVSFQNVTDSGYVPSDTENLTCSPEELFEQLTSLSFNSPFLFFSWNGFPEDVLLPPEGVDFDEATWGSRTNDPAEVMQASVACVNYGINLKNPVRVKIRETFPPSCLKTFIKDGVEYTPDRILLIAEGTSWDNEDPPGRLCEFANTGTIVSKYSNMFQPEFFTIGAIWENLNYTGDEPGDPRYYNVLLSKFTADFLLTVNTTPPGGGRTMTTTKTGGPGTELAKLLKWFNIHAKEGGCGCKSMQKKMDKGGPQYCRDHKKEILAHLEKEAKKRGLPFIKLAASKLIDLAIRRSERGQ